MFAKEVNQYWNANNKFRGGGSIHSKSSLDRDLFHQTDLNLNVTTEQKLWCTVLSGSNMSFAVIYQNVAIVVCQHWKVAAWFPYATKALSTYWIVSKQESWFIWSICWHSIFIQHSSLDLAECSLSSQSDGDGAWVRYSARYNVHCGHVALSGGEAQISAGYGAKIWVVGSGEQRALGLTTVIITSHTSPSCAHH